MQNKLQTNVAAPSFGPSKQTENTKKDKNRKKIETEVSNAGKWVHGRLRIGALEATLLHKIY